MILLIDNYDSFTFNLYQHMGELGAEVDVIRNDQITLDQIESRLPEIDQIVVSPGPCTPIEAGISVDVIRRFTGRTPILGVCLGHQAIGEAFGAEIVGAPHIMHGKTSRIHHDGAGVFRDLPNPLEATRYHSLVVRRDSLPDELQVVAETEDGIVMGLRHRDFPIYGVQFHPESILTPAGKDLLRNFLGLAPVGSTVTPLELVGY